MSQADTEHVDGRGTWLGLLQEAPEQTFCERPLGNTLLKYDHVFWL